jgi:hypothetical protein
MPFNGAGVFTRIFSWVTDRNGGIKILASRMDQEMDGFATGLSNTITRDGQSTVTQDIPFNNRKITGLGAATNDGDALNRVTADGRYLQSIADGSVTTAKIADANVTLAKLAATVARGVAKAWANLNGTGTIALRDSFGVSSVVDNGTGDYTFNWANSMANGNYKVTATSDNSVTTNLPGVSGFASNHAPAVGSARMFNVNGSEAARDATFYHVAIDGDLA